MMMIGEFNRKIYTSQKEALIKTDQDYSADNGARSDVYDITGRSIFGQTYNSTFSIVVENLNKIIVNMHHLE
jgi:hypothetical protein